MTLGVLATLPGLRLGRLRDPDSLRNAARIEDVIAFCFRRRLYRTGRNQELRCQCWRADHKPDTRPSCRIDTGKRVFFCDVCGSGGDVFRVVKEWLDDSFVGAVSWLDQHLEEIPAARVRSLPASSRFTAPTAQVAATTGARAVYPYFDVQWQLRFEKVRTADKRFFYRHRRADGSWAWGLGATSTFLYRLPMIHGVAFVLVVEGEKDVETAWDHNLPATTNPEGAGNGKWKRTYTRQLVTAGVRRVYVIPDNDDVGRLHASQIVASCRAARLRAWLVPLPGLPLHGDFTDYMALGHTRRDVFALLRRSRRTR